MDVLALLPGALGIALSPLSVAAVLFLLAGRRGRGSAVAFACGWVLVIAVALAVAVFVGERLPAPDAGGGRVQDWAAVGAGVVLGALAVWQWRRRRLPDGRPASARWADAMEALRPVHAFTAGVVLFASPKLVVSVLSAGLVLGELLRSPHLVLVVGTAFVLVSASTVIVPIVLVVVLRERARRVLAVVRAWIGRWGQDALVAVLAVLAVVQLVLGVTGLVGS